MIDDSMRIFLICLIISIGDYDIWFDAIDEGRRIAALARA